MNAAHVVNEVITVIDIPDPVLGPGPGPGPGPEEALVRLSAAQSSQTLQAWCGDAAC